MNRDRAKEFYGYARKAFTAGAVAATSTTGALATIQVNAPADVVFPWYWYAAAALIPWAAGFWLTYRANNDDAAK